MIGQGIVSLMAQEKDVVLPPRTFEVLHSLVQTYIETGEPVASRAIARKRRDGLSAATIRNIMADLADLGFLDQPHTSAGRVPTAKAFRQFVRPLLASRILAAELERLRQELVTHSTLDARAEHASHLLTELTRNIGIFAAMSGKSQELDQVEFVLLPPSRVLMVVATSDGLVRSQVAQLQEPVSADELASIRNYVNRNFHGWKLQDIRRELERRFQEESSAYDAVMQRLTVLYEKGLLDVGLTPRVYLEGASVLVGLELHLTKERLRDLLRALEEKKRLMELLDQFLHQGGEDLQVQVGLEDAHPALRDFALIGLTIQMPGGIESKLAVLGPMRMNYSRVMSAVLHVGQALRSLPQ
jgi:heat-inducible transcriptional repressor